MRDSEQNGQVVLGESIYLGSVAEQSVCPAATSLTLAPYGSVLSARTSFSLSSLA